MGSYQKDRMRHVLQIGNRSCHQRNNHAIEHKEQLFRTRLFIASSVLMEHSKLRKIKLCSTEKEINRVLGSLSHVSHAQCSCESI